MRNQFVRIRKKTHERSKHVTRCGTASIAAVSFVSFRQNWCELRSDPILLGFFGRTSAKAVKMDCEKLILLVQERRYLWDQRESNYHMRNVQKQLWKEVSTEMKLPEEDIKKRWRGLRDTFRKEFMKQSKTKTGSGGNESQSSSWPFFNQLSFLSDTIKPRSMQSSVPPVESDNMSITTDEGEEIYDSEELADVGHTDLQPQGLIGGVLIFSNKHPLPQAPRNSLKAHSKRK